MICNACGAENRAGRKFCAACGASLARACPSCGAANDPDDRFCGDCGTALSAPSSESPSATREPLAERRVVSVLFADLVGFTMRSEDEDPEEVRELLTRYFETARRVIERYGGIVEKFIGDAVMAVWGTPVAQEDDAERAVRAALDLVAAVPQLDERLHARAGVLTGEAAVTVGAEGQGMVAGDLVNTASRIQAVAEPGAVLVGEATRRASDAAIAYEDAGQHELKGKAEQIPLWRAVRVVAARGGEGRSLGLEPPFVGREAEFRLVKDLFHATIDERKARLVSVVGVAGLGKTRLTWEFEKYIDGVVEQIWWHRGRSLAYGEGVAYWALGEMVRMRAGILEEEAPDSALAKLRESLTEHVPDPEERAWLEPRLAHLLGLEERTAADREDLFSAWRLFFERLADAGPTVLVFEDLHWADAGLLDFVEYLLEWSRNHPIFVLTLARPELMDRRPSWGAGKRSFTSLFLEPLSDGATDSLLGGLVPGLPDEVRAQIAERSEGIPLYAVETVRMLLDRGLIAREEGEYRLAGPVESLEVPETMHALIAARLDGLKPDERGLVSHAAVLGRTFSARALGALTSSAENELEPILVALIRKEILTRDVDPRSPERGQYSFVQDLLRQVAYETLARAERKVRHLAIARFLETGWGSEEDEIVEVVAAHYLEAYRTVPDADDVAEIKSKARELLARAGERASSLAAREEAQRYFEQAAELADDHVVEAELLERGGMTAHAAGRLDAAGRNYERAISRFEAAGLTHPAARVSARLALTLWERGAVAEAIERLERSFDVLRKDEPDEDLARLAAELGRQHFFAGNAKRADEMTEYTLDVAEALGLAEVISEALNTRALLRVETRPQEALVLVRGALEIALENDVPTAALRAYNNLATLVLDLDRYEEAIGYLERGLSLARKRGDRQWERQILASLADPLYLSGRWDEVLAHAAEIPEEARQGGWIALALLTALSRIRVNRGELGEARRALDALAGAEESDDRQLLAAYALGRAIVWRAEGRPAEAFEEAARARAFRDIGSRFLNVEGFVEAVEAAFELEDLGRVDQLLAEVDELPRALLTPSLHAHRDRARARRAARRAQGEQAEQAFKQAAALLRELGVVFWLAVTLLEHAEWLAEQGRTEDAEPLVAEASEIFERLRAVPWLERAARATPVAEPLRG